MSFTATASSPALLIVDDDPDVLRALGFMADTRGFRVDRCTSAEEALAASAARGPFDCMIIDEKLPDQPGIDLLEGLRGRGVPAPAVLITTAPSAHLRRRAAALGAPIVEKPLLDEALFTEVLRLLRRD